MKRLTKSLVALCGIVSLGVACSDQASPVDPLPRASRNISSATDSSASSVATGRVLHSPRKQVLSEDVSVLTDLLACCSSPYGTYPNGIPNNGIAYNGGPVMLGTTNVYLVWYGGWDKNTARLIIPDLVKTLGGSPWYGIDTGYYSIVTRPDGTSSREYVTNSVRLAGEADDAYSKGKALSVSDVPTVVQSLISDGKLPFDQNGVYFVLASQDVDQDGACTTYCGWHDFVQYGSDGSTLKYAYIFDSSRCPRDCTAFSQDASGAWISPNDNIGADGMASVIAHELVESVSDPEISAWNTNVVENADMCAWKFGTTYAASNGAKANVRFGGRDFLIQQNWVNACGGFCGLSWVRLVEQCDAGPMTSVVGKEHDDSSH